jgi:hypothetical protein
VDTSAPPQENDPVPPPEPEKAPLTVRTVRVLGLIKVLAFIKHNFNDEAAGFFAVLRLRGAGSGTVNGGQILKFLSQRLGV